MTTYTAYLLTESGSAILTEDGKYLLAENTVPIVPQPPYPLPIVKPRDFPRLSKGVNLAGWYTLNGAQLITDADLALIKKEGFDHVRLNIAPGWTNPIPAEGGPTDAVGFGWDATDVDGKIPGADTVDLAIQMCIDAGLEVIIDLHTTMTTDNEKLLDPQYHHQNQPDPVAYVRPYQYSFCVMWRRIAERYRDYPQNAIAYEVMNEPQFYGYETNWFDFRNRIVAAIREIDSLHYILTPTPWGGGTGYLWRNESVADSACGLAIHSYEPFDYTHRLTEWTGISNPRNWVLNFKYPKQNNAIPSMRTLYKDDSVTQQDFDNYLASINYPDAAQSMLDSFDAENWDTYAFDWIADYVAEYCAPRANIRGFINEFGTYKQPYPMLPFYDPAGGHWSAPWRLEQNYVAIDLDEQSRSAYLHDSRSCWERKKLGWTAFGYAGNFGISNIIGESYYRDNGENCPVYGGVWSRAFNVENLNALIPQNVWYAKCPGNDNWNNLIQLMTGWNYMQEGQTNWTDIVEDDSTVIPCSGNN
jgi:aryl-phospho-beta-D-glucosidase BglC (GH1 family)